MALRGGREGGRREGGGREGGREEVTVVAITGVMSCDL